MGDGEIPAVPIGSPRGKCYKEHWFSHGSIVVHNYTTCSFKDLLFTSWNDCSSSITWCSFKQYPVSGNHKTLFLSGSLFSREKNNPWIIIFSFSIIFQNNYTKVQIEPWNYCYNWGLKSEVSPIQQIRDIIWNRWNLGLSLSFKNSFRFELLYCC